MRTTSRFILCFVTICGWTVIGQIPRAGSNSISLFGVIPQTNVHNEGSSLWVQCGYLSHGEYFKWFIGDRRQERISNYGTLEELHFKPLWTDNGKQVRCQKFSTDSEILDERVHSLKIKWADDTTRIRFHVFPTNLPYKEGDSVQATCGMLTSYTDGNLTWFIGDSVITRGIEKLPTLIDHSSNLFTVQDVLVHNLTWTDNENDIRCAITPYKGAISEVKRETLHVNYAPRNRSEVFYQHGFHIGGSGFVVVDVVARPEPIFRWSWTLNGGIDSSSDRTFTVHDMIELGLNAYRSVLYVNNFSRAHVGTMFTIVTRNAIGEKSFRIQLTEIQEMAGLSVPPRLTLWPSIYEKGAGVYREGENLVAQCVVRGGRSAPALRWFVGSSPLMTGPTRVIVPNEYYNETTINETIFLQLTWENNKMAISCEAQNTGKDLKERSAGVRITVNFAPRKKSESQVYHSLIPGGSGYVTVDVLANPGPESVTWHIDDTQLTAGSATQDGRYNSLSILQVSESTWRLSLLIKKITEADSTRRFYVIVRNKIGDNTIIISKAAQNLEEPLSTPSLQLVRGTRSGVYKEGDLLEATCTIERNHSAPALQWYVGDTPVTSHISEAVTSDSSYTMVTKRETWMHNANRDENGMYVRCVSVMPSGHDSREDKIMLKVQFRPVGEYNGPIHLDGYIVGETGHISVVVRANPRPSLAWSVGGVSVPRSGEDTSSPYEVQVVQVNNDTVRSVLIIKNLTDKHLDEKYYLHAKNSLGQTRFNITIASASEGSSTSRYPVFTAIQKSRQSNPLNASRDFPVLTAVCEVMGGRSAPLLSWRLGDTTITAGVSTTFSTSNSTDDQLTVTSKLRYRLTWKNNRDILSCIAGDVDSARDESIISRPLTVQYSPKILPTPTYIENFVFGEAGNITVRVQADPEPRFTWRVNGSALSQFKNRFQARVAMDPELKDGWRAILLLKPFQIEDVATEFMLKAYNVEGSASDTITISAGEVEKQANSSGSVVAIILVLLLLLIIITTVIFARKSKLCCFNGDSVTPEEVKEAEKHEDTDVLYAVPKKRKKGSPKPDVAAGDVQAMYAVVQKKDKKKQKVVINMGKVAGSPMGSEIKTEAQPDIVYAKLDLLPSSSASVRRREDPVIYADIMKN